MAGAEGREVGDEVDYKEGLAGSHDSFGFYSERNRSPLELWCAGKLGLKSRSPVFFEHLSIFVNTPTMPYSKLPR